MPAWLAVPNWLAEPGSPACAADLTVPITPPAACVGDVSVAATSPGLLYSGPGSSEAARSAAAGTSRGGRDSPEDDLTPSPSLNPNQALSPDGIHEYMSTADGTVVGYRIHGVVDTLPPPQAIHMQPRPPRRTRHSTTPSMPRSPPKLSSTPDLNEIDW